METLLTGLLMELKERCLAIQRILEARKSNSQIRDYIEEIYAGADQILTEIEALLRDPDLGNARLLPNQFFAFSRLAEKLSGIEWHPLSAITRYDDTDTYMGCLCALLARQINYPIACPLVSGFSGNYYGAIPPYRLIRVPATEHLFLLGLPDMCHEMGHIVFYNYKGDFLGRFLSTITSYIRDEKARRISEGASPRYQELYDRLEADWKDRWTTEFTCDMIATFMVGPAFGHTHLRLCCSLDPDIFRPGFGESSTHPSGEARLRAITAMLRVMGLNNDAKLIQDQWARYLVVDGGRKPMEYDLCYPDMLVDSLTREVHNGCMKVGLVSYKDQKASDNDLNLPLLLNEAWTVLLSDTRNYANWEAEQIKRLKDYAVRGS